MKRDSVARWIAVLLGVSCGAALLVDPSLAASPDSGSVGPGKPDPITWNGEVSSTARQAVKGPDVFILTVDVEDEFWAANDGGVTVTITWPDEKENFDIQIYERNPDGTSGAFAGESSRRPPGTSETVVIPEELIRDTSGVYFVRAIYATVINSGYTGTASFSSKATGGEAPTQVVFETNETLAFAPATIVSAHFLGTEPMMTLERSVPESLPGAIDPDRIFVDWPLSSRSMVGQLSRSEDGGDSFRLLFDPTCAQRSRPNCATGGGGDTVTDVNLIDGTLYFSDQEFVVGNEALASSTDHGDSFPLERQHVISNATVTDRQWLASAGDAVQLEPTQLEPMGTEVGAFLAYHVPIWGQYIQAIVRSDGRDDGRPLPQRDPQISSVVQSGPLRVDTTSGPGRGWLYQPYESFDPGGLYVATAPGARYSDGHAWTAVSLTPDGLLGFPWLELDERGNAYALWVNADGRLFYRASPIEHDLNNPNKCDPSGRCGRPGTFWTDAAEVTPPPPGRVGSVAFPEIVAGAPGRVAITYLACPHPCGGTDDPYFGPSDGAPADAEWHAYAAIITNALQTGGLPARVTTGQVSHRPVHSSQICTSGLFCMSPSEVISKPGDRSLADMIDIGYDEGGRVVVVFTDNNSTFGNQPGSPSAPADKTRPFAHFAKQVSGPSLLDNATDVAVAVPSGEVTDGDNDATWPNTAEGVPLESLDARGLSVRAEGVGPDGHKIVARLTLDDTDCSSTGTPHRLCSMADDLVGYNNAHDDKGPGGLRRDFPDAERLQYIVRVTTDSDIYHLSASYSDDGALFFGGLLDANDALRDPGGTILGAAYKADGGFLVTGELLLGSTPEEADTLVLSAPLSALGLEVGDPVYSVTAFTTAGPRAEDESLTNPMRTVDATPPFDAVLAVAIPEPPTLAFITEPGLTGQHSDHATFQTSLTDANGDPITNATVDFAFVGPIPARPRTSSGITDAKGIATTTVELLDAAGPARITASYVDPSGTFEPSTAFYDFVIEHEVTSLDLEVVRGQGPPRLEATLSDDDVPPSPAAGKMIDMWAADGTKICSSALTDGSGVASCELPPRYRGAHHHFEAVFAGDNYHAGSTASYPA